MVSASVSDSSLTPGQSFTLSAAVRNQGTGPSAATTLQYYRSTNATISTRDRQVGDDRIGALAAAGTSAESIRLRAPSSADTFYYGACVESMSGEAQENNCSIGVRVIVEKADTRPVTIPDSNLRAAIEAALGKVRGAPITVAEMRTMDSLNASNYTDEPEIRDLTGLESATNLTSLSLDRNGITDVSALAGLVNLTSLSLYRNDISDISALAGLVNLTFLDLELNLVTDISALTSLTNLKTLFLRANSLRQRLN